MKSTFSIKNPEKYQTSEISCKTVRPTCQIEEVKLSTNSVVGRTRWLPIKIDFSNNDNEQFFNTLQVYNLDEFISSLTITINNYDDKDNKLESWTLKTAFFKSVNFGPIDYLTNDDLKVELEIVYNDVEYKQYSKKSNKINFWTKRKKQPKTIYKLISN